MSRKLKYKIISCSSEESEYPVSSLLFAGSQGWQSQRFCTFPQQITLQFYGITKVSKIQLVSDHRKIASQVDLLYYLPQSAATQQRFYKYGYLQFSRNESGHARQQKTVMVDMTCIYLRLLFHKPYPAKDNFFSQVGIHQLNIYGGEGSLQSSSIPQSLPVQDEEEEDSYVYERIAELNAKKQKAIDQQDYEQAQICKGFIALIKDLGVKIKEMNADKQRAINNEDYEKAKLIKADIEAKKKEVDDILLSGEENQDNQFQDLNEQQLQNDNNYFQDNEFVDKDFIQSQNRSRTRQGQSRGDLSNSRLSRSKLNLSRKIKQTEPVYDQRVIPALLGKQKTDPSEQVDLNEKKVEFEVEEVDGKFIKDSLVMQQFFDQNTVKKFFSRHWQHKAESLTEIQAQMSAKPKDASLMKCLITVVKHVISQTNFQISVKSMQLLQQTLKMNKASQIMAKPGDLQNDLEEIGKEIIKKLSDNNQKIKGLSEQIFEQMVDSQLYGSQICCSLLMKTKGKLSPKQESSRLAFLTKIIANHPIPPAVLDYGVEQLNNPSIEVRNQAITLIATAYKKDSAKVQTKISGLKGSVYQQIQKKSTQLPAGKEAKSPPKKK